MGEERIGWESLAGPEDSKTKQGLRKEDTQKACAQIAATQDSWLYRPVNKAYVRSLSLPFCLGAQGLAISLETIGQSHVPSLPRLSGSSPSSPRGPLVPMVPARTHLFVLTGPFCGANVHLEEGEKH